MKTYQVQADSNNGVYIVSQFQDDAIILDQDDFHWRLSRSGEEEILGAIIDQDFFDKINEEYGIRV